ncbi:MAG: DUF3052 domain-containing protein [Pseudomonadota bacterium]
MQPKSIAEKMLLMSARSLAIVNGAVHPKVVAQMPAQLIDAAQNAAAGAADVVLLFSLNRKELERLIPEAEARLATKGALWVAFQKGPAARLTDLNRDAIDACVQPRGLAGVGTIALDKYWSALRLRRVQDPAPAP